MEKRKAHHSLAAIKTTFRDAARLNRTLSAVRGAQTLGMNDDAVVDAIAELTMRDFDKSMTSIADHRNWQDVYRPERKGRRLYVKFTLDAQGELLLISFKEADE